MCDRAGDKHEEEVPGCCGCVRFFHTIYAIYVTPAVLSSEHPGLSIDAILVWAGLIMHMDRKCNYCILWPQRIFFFADIMILLLKIKSKCTVI